MESYWVGWDREKKIIKYFNKKKWKKGVYSISRNEMVNLNWYQKKEKKKKIIMLNGTKGITNLLLRPLYKKVVGAILGCQREPWQCLMVVSHDYEPKWNVIVSLDLYCGHQRDDLL